MVVDFAKIMINVFFKILMKSKCSIFILLVHIVSPKVNN